MRLFIAIPLPSVFQETLNTLLLPLQEAILREGTSVKWVHPPQFHLTLRFLGECREDQVPAISESIAKSTAGVSSFELDFEKLGCFPLTGKPVVLWLGVGSNARAVGELAAQLEKALEPLGFPAERRPYHAHLTLGRCRVVRNTRPLSVRLDEFSVKALGPVPAASVSLIRSVLSAEGPDYRVLQTVPFRP